MNIKDLKPTKKIKIDARIDIDLEDTLRQIEKKQNVKYSQVVNFVLRAGIEAVNK